MTNDSGSSFADVIAPTGTLRAVINLGNPVLAQGTPAAPSGVTVAMAERLARWLEVDLELRCVTAARDSYAAMLAGAGDVCFLANEPAREEGLAFTAPYVVIEGVYVTDADSALADAHEVDREGIRIAVREGSAYDLFLTRSVSSAEVVRGAEASDVYEEQRLDVVAGVRQPMAAYAARTGRRVLEPAFMQINQAVALPQSLAPDAVAAVTAEVERMKASGFVHDELVRSGQRATVAPPA